MSKNLDSSRLQNLAAFVPKKSIHFLFLIGLLLIATNLRSSITAVGPVLSQIQHSLSLSETSAGFLNALPLFAFGILSFFSPPIAKKIGIEKTIGLALILIAIGGILRSLPLIGMLWVGTLLIGSGIAFCNVLLPTLIKRDYPHKMVLLISLYSATMGIFASIASGISVPLANAIPVDGWRWSIGIWSILAILAFLAWLPQLKTRTIPMHGISAALDPHPQEYRSPWSSALGWQIATMMLTQTLVFYTLIDWFSSYAVDHGISAEKAGFDLFIYQIVAVAANLITVPLIKLAKDQRLLGFSCSMFIFIGVIGLYIQPSYALLWLTLAGIGAGSSLVLTLSLFGLRTIAHGQATALSGMAQFFGYTFGAFGPIAFGLIHSLTNSWSYAIYILIAASAIQMIVAVLAGRERVMV